MYFTPLFIIRTDYTFLKLKSNCVKILNHVLFVCLYVMSKQCLIFYINVRKNPRRIDMINIYVNYVLFPVNV